MKYHDDIYGEVEINEPLILALLETNALKRLDGIMQHGITALIGVTEPITRLDHSIGAMLLVRRMGASVEEQAAALLHDVSHTVYSHVIDNVFDSALSQSYHDNVKAEYVGTTQIPDVLTKFGLDWEYVLEETNYPILEQPSPRLCGDRVDYSLRDSVPMGVATLSDVQDLLSHLVLHEGRIMVDSIQAGRWLADVFIEMDQKSWANFWEVGLYELTARALRHAFKIGAMTYEDLWRTDAVVWEELHAHPDADLQAMLKLVSPDVEIVWDAENPTFAVATKLRTIDPDVVGSGGDYRPLSQRDPTYKQKRETYLEQNKGAWPMRVIV